MYVLKKSFYALGRTQVHFIVQWFPLSFPEPLVWKPALFGGSESGNVFNTFIDSCQYVCKKSLNNTLHDIQEKSV